jgi:hypothetical protein
MGRAGERPGFRFKIAYNRRVQTATACSAHRIEITGAASRSEEPLAAIEHGHSGAVLSHTLGRKPKLTLHHQKREAIRRRDELGEPVREIARSYNVSQSTISRLGA